MASCCATYGDELAGHIIVDCAVAHDGHPVVLATPRHDLSVGDRRMTDHPPGFEWPVPVPRPFHIIRHAPGGGLSVVVRQDPAARDVVIEGYGEATDKPLEVEKVHFGGR